MTLLRIFIYAKESNFTKMFKTFNTYCEIFMEVRPTIKEETLCLKTFVC